MQAAVSQRAAPLATDNIFAQVGRIPQVTRGIPLGNSDPFKRKYDQMEDLGHALLGQKQLNDLLAQRRAGHGKI
jgi:hypothetical protein